VGSGGDRGRSVRGARGSVFSARGTRASALAAWRSSLGARPQRGAAGSGLTGVVEALAAVGSWTRSSRVRALGPRRSARGARDRDVGLRRTRSALTASALVGMAGLRTVGHGELGVGAVGSPARLRGLGHVGLPARLRGAPGTAKWRGGPRNRGRGLGACGRGLGPRARRVERALGRADRRRRAEGRRGHDRLRGHQRGAREIQATLRIVNPFVWARRSALRRAYSSS
jgi:hypothetical protein